MKRNDSEKIARYNAFNKLDNHLFFFKAIIPHRARFVYTSRCTRYFPLIAIRHDRAGYMLVSIILVSIWRDALCAKSRVDRPRPRILTFPAHVRYSSMLQILSHYAKLTKLQLLYLAVAESYTRVSVIRCKLINRD